MSEWKLDASSKDKTELEAHLDNLNTDYEYKIEEIGGVEGAYWGLYRKVIE